jgi:DNA-binding MarR family transcriptional regulator
MIYGPDIDLREKVGILVRKAHFRASDVIAKHLKQHDLTPRQYSILCILSYGQFSQKELAEMIVITENVMLELALQLENRKLLARKRFQDDRRQYRLTLTAKGSQVYKAATVQLEEAHKELARDFSPEEWKSGLAFLLKLCGPEAERYPGSGGR